MNVKTQMESCQKETENTSTSSHKRPSDFPSSGNCAASGNETSTKRHRQTDTLDEQNHLRTLKKTFECSLCLWVFLDPVTLPCGHSFCRSCLAQSFESKMECPLCRHKCLNDVASLPLTYALADAAKQLFPDVLQRRRQELQEYEVNRSSFRIPLFFIPGEIFPPTKVVRLRVFEPRYLMMIEKIAKSGKGFGIQEHANSDVGALAKLHTVNRRPIGDMLILCNITSRYFIEEGTCRVEPDTQGLHTARVRTVKDEQIAQGGADSASDEEFAKALFRVLHSGFRQAINRMSMKNAVKFFHFNGQLPCAAEDLSYFAIAALHMPLELKYYCLRSVNLLERLRVIYVYADKLRWEAQRIKEGSHQPEQGQEQEEDPVVKAAYRSVINTPVNSIVDSASMITSDSILSFDEENNGLPLL